MLLLINVLVQAMRLKVLESGSRVLSLKSKTSPFPRSLAEDVLYTLEILPEFVLNRVKSFTSSNWTLGDAPALFGDMVITRGNATNADWPLRFKSGRFEASGHKTNFFLPFVLQTDGGMSHLDEPKKAACLQERAQFCTMHLDMHDTLVKCSIIELAYTAEILQLDLQPKLGATVIG